MLKITFTLILTTFLKVSVGQYTICDCCSASLYYKSEFEDSLFNPLVIKANKINELTIFTTSQKMIIKGKDTSYSVVDKEYKELIYRFNAQGLMEKKIVFNRLGQFHSAYDYSRDAFGRITKVVFHYLDSLGIPVHDLLVETEDYFYTGSYLSKTKKRDDKQNALPDEKASYESYEYDKKGRVNKANYYTYYDWTKPKDFYRITSYNDTLNRSVTKTFDNKKLFTTKKTIFNKSNNPSVSKFYDRANKLLQEEYYAYDPANRIVKYIQKSYPGMGTECPDGGNFANIYSYNSMGLLETIRHTFKTSQCLLRFEYK